MNDKTKKLKRERRHARVRARIIGTKERPRISVFKSNKNIFVQLIDDEQGKTILSSKISSATKGKAKHTKTDKSLEIGKELADKAKEKGIKEAVFDRGGYKYHGRIKSVADGLRAGGLKF